MAETAVLAFPQVRRVDGCPRCGSPVLTAPGAGYDPWCALCGDLTGRRAPDPAEEAAAAREFRLGELHAEREARLEKLERRRARRSARSAALPERLAA